MTSKMNSLWNSIRLIWFDRLYFAVDQAEPEKWAQKHSRLSRPLSDIWTSKTCIRVGPEVSMSDRTNRSDSFRTSAHMCLIAHISTHQHFQKLYPLSGTYPFQLCSPDWYKKVLDSYHFGKIKAMFRSRKFLFWALYFIFMKHCNLSFWIAG